MYIVLYITTKVILINSFKCHDTHSAIFLSRDFFALDPFLSRDFSRRKNALCVHGTIEIALERIQRDIAANLRRQKCREFALCVS